MVTYKDSGVDIDAQDKAISLIKSMVKGTKIPGVLSDVGNFGGLFSINELGLTEPVLVSSSDGVGTKVKLALLTNVYDTVGQDLVNHCINDILVQGAFPLYFLDYVGVDKMRPDIMERVISGFCKACNENKMALLGGEMAEMGGVYVKDHFDLVGFIVGVVDKKNIIDGKKIKPGDVIVGLKSTGLQTNGYTLAIKLFKEAGLLEKKAEELMAVHESFLPYIRPHLGNGMIHGMAHITGGGLIDNIPRVLPDNCEAVIDKSTWEVPEIFKEIQKLGDVPEEDMIRTFNMGIGFVVILDKADAEKIQNGIIIGEIKEGDKKVSFTSEFN